MEIVLKLVLIDIIHLKVFLQIKKKHAKIIMKDA